MNRAILKNNEERRLLRGHLWAYRTEFTSLPSIEDGDLADVYTPRGKFVGRGFFQAEGGIAVRLLDRHQMDVDTAFFRRRIEEALALRQRFFPGQNVYRWIHGESDGLPGLIVDRYDALVTIHTQCAFYGVHSKALLNAFMGQEGITGVRLDCAGEITHKGETPTDLEIEIDGIRLGFSPERGQKTGLFLDQRENARLLDAIAPGARVLDGNCYVGQWSLRAAKAGAAKVIGVDSSAQAITQAKTNATLNGLEDTCQFECADINEFLAKAKQFDVVCIDPPALAKSRARLSQALGRYQGLNRDAMKAVKKDGYLITSSCSRWVDESSFLEMVKRAARSAQRSAVIHAVRTAPADHPVLLAMPETAYLTCVLLRIG
jgi:23S rRNA (cytosine1962-C5)-methyltransferase